MHRPTRCLAAAAALLLALTVSACGGDDEGEAPQGVQEEAQPGDEAEDGGDEAYEDVLEDQGGYGDGDDG